MRRARLARRALILAVCVFSLNAVATTSDEQARALAVETVREYFTDRNYAFLETDRLENEEEHFIGVTYDIRTGRGPVPPYFFKVYDSGWEITENGVRLHATSPPGAPVYIAVSRTSGSAYRIGGFRDSIQELIRLAKDSGVQIKDARAALTYAKLVVDFAVGPLRFPENRLELKHLVEESFVRDSGNEAQANANFLRWWRRFQRETRGEKLEPAVLTNPDGSFTVNLTRLTYNNRDFLVDRLSFLILKDGSISLQACLHLVSPLKSRRGRDQAVEPEAVRCK